MSMVWETTPETASTLMKELAELMTALASWRFRSPGADLGAPSWELEFTVTSESSQKGTFVVLVLVPTPSE